jgi:hypothetical protein
MDQESVKMPKGEVVPCAVLIDDHVPDGTMEMSPKIFKKARVDEGSRVVVNSEVDGTKVRGVMGGNLKRCEVAMGTKLALFLGIREGEEVDVQASISIGGNRPVEVEDFEEVLAQPQERLEPLMGDDLHHFSGLTVDQVLDHLARHGDEYSGRYLVTAPKPHGAGAARGEVCEDPSLGVKFWDPSEK